MQQQDNDRQQSWVALQSKVCAMPFDLMTIACERATVASIFVTCMLVLTLRARHPRHCMQLCVSAQHSDHICHQAMHAYMTSLHVAFKQHLSMEHKNPPVQAMANPFRRHHHFCLAAADLCQQLNVNNPLLDGAIQTFWPQGLCGGEEGAWVSTGLWAPAGAAITIKIEQTSSNYALAKARLGVQIGSHT